MRKSFLIPIAILAVVVLLIGVAVTKNKRSNVGLPLPSGFTSTPAGNITSANLPLTLPPGYILGIFAQNLGGVRDLEFSPGGTLLASITSSGKVVGLPDKNGDGRVDQAKEILTGLNKPHGLSFFGGKLFVAQESNVSRYNWNEQNLTATLDKKLFDLPRGGRHFTRTIAFNKMGQMFVSVGSTCDVCFEKQPFLAAVIVSDSEGAKPRLFAKGLRNSVFIAINPKTGELWGTEMGRDYLGDNLPPDEINIIRDGNPSTGSGPRDYGWPNCYGDKTPDTSFNPSASKNTCENTELPIYKIQAHSAPLGLTFINSSQFPTDWQGDLLVSYHGSWNRSVPDGYKVVHMKVSGNQILSEEDFISGFIQGSQVIGRPVDLTYDVMGNLYISDDKNGTVYIVGRK